MESKKWKIFIVTHGPVEEQYYANDPLFTNEHYEFFNVSNKNLCHSRFRITNKNEVESYNYLGKWYAEAEVIYNVYKNNLYENLDYVGFIHWDYELKSQDRTIGYNVTEAIDKVVEKGVPFISFSSYNFEEIYNQRIMMDPRYPNHKIGNGKNCFDTIIEEYNEFFKKRMSVNDVLGRRINLCSAFLCSSAVFDHLMSFYSFIIEKKEIEKFDTNHTYRFQGGLLERYIGCYSADLDFAEIELIHHSDHAKEKTKAQFLLGRINTIKYRIKQSLFNLFIKK
jgi:hypothetical protein